MIYDASVLLYCDCNFKIKTVPEVLGEIKNKKSRFLLEFRDVEAIEPEDRFVRLVEKAAGKKLSEADKKLVALALQLKEEIITDDHGIQEVACLLGLKVRNFHFKPCKNFK